ncbi:hypothetical protein BLOT_004979 [Blomia tropicalis]|nr:hypothetical protein BLOT_004979 [Blomia tropicalis]
MKHGVSDLVDKEDLSIGSIVQGSMRQCSTDGVRSLVMTPKKFVKTSAAILIMMAKSSLKINFVKNLYYCYYYKLLNSKCYYSFFVNGRTNNALYERTKTTKVSNYRLIAIAIYFTLAIAYNYKHITFNI